MSRLRDGFFVTEDGSEKIVFAIVNGAMVQVEPDGPVRDLGPGYYDAVLRPVPASEAEARASTPRA